ncbi:unnamed protein product [Polarella glacialis]|uniref:Cyclic nucleotide-binding domain-containing protein n=1 Tax=Polarella glacialis TaxID=89957 RepID=A0A813E4I8_POLGL|nr:unnamed protein product [Polarella glacialis]
MMSKIIAFPGSLSRVCWDLIGAALILYDLFVIPMKVFDPPETLVTITMDWFTLLFWTLNVANTLTVGFVTGGNTVMSPLLILKNYLKRWFLIDCIVLVPDWAFTVASSGADSGSESIKMLRILRLARTARLLRLFKLKWILDRINDYLDSEFGSIITDVVKMVVLLVTINHFIACAWFAIGNQNSNTDEDSWIKAHGFQRSDWKYQYMTAFHWSITQFTPAGMEVQPHNMSERSFTVSVVIFALVGFSYMVGSITGSLAQLRSMSAGATKEFWLLRRFLKRNSVPMTLSLRIQRFVEHAHKRQQQTMSITQVKILSLLSEQLMEELQCAINLPHLNVHPLFQFLNGFSTITMQRLAKDAVGRVRMAKGDTLFLPNQKATCMYFIASGGVEYTRTFEEKAVREFLDAGEDWIAEPIMWTPSWIHVGEAKAVTESELLCVKPKTFEDILSLVGPVAAVV